MPVYRGTSEDKVLRDIEPKDFGVGSISLEKQAVNKQKYKINEANNKFWWDNGLRKSSVAMFTQLNRRVATMCTHFIWSSGLPYAVHHFSFLYGLGLLHTYNFSYFILESSVTHCSKHKMVGAKLFEHLRIELCI